MALENRGDEAGLALALECPLPGGHLVDDRAEREEVRARIRLFAFDLLRRHVLKRAEDRPRRRQMRRGRRQPRQARTRDRPCDSLGQPEVEQLHAGFRQHDVAWLQIPVNDARAVRRGEGIGDFNGVAE
jgi:hypothetical protein